MGKDLKGKELGTGLSQRADGRYTARYTDQYGKRLQFYDFKISKAKQWLMDVKYEDEHGLLGDAKSVTLAKWFDQWMTTYKTGVVSLATEKNYRNSFDIHIKPHLGNLQVKTIKSINLQKILNDMYDSGYSYGTMNLVKITMGAIFKSAVDNNLITKSPVVGIKCKQRDVEERRVLTIDEQKEFVKYAEKSMYYNAYILCLQTGLRCGELGALKWEDIDFENRVINVNKTLLFDKSKNGFYFGYPKTKAGIRIIPLTNDAIVVLKSQKVEQFKLRAKSIKWEKNTEFQDLVFTSINGKPTGHSSYRNNLMRIVTNINKDRRALAEINNTEFIEFKPMYMHALRHTFATRSIENGIKPKVLQTFLGHASLSVTMDLYVHVTEESKHEEIKKISNIIKMG